MSIENSEPPPARLTILDIHKEPEMDLLPISGHEKQPLLPLKEACEPLYSIVARLAQYVQIALNNSKRLSDREGLTVDESAAIQLYTMEWPESSSSFYAILNRTLREFNRAKLKPWFKYLKLVLTALYKLPDNKGLVWRGINEDLSTIYEEGRNYTWWAFNSCTSSVTILESPQYLGKTGIRTLFTIETTSGKIIKAHSYYKTENEVLLLPGTYFCVIGLLNPAPGFYIFHLKQQTPSDTLIEPPFDVHSQLQPLSRLLQNDRTEIIDINVILSFPFKIKIKQSETFPLERASTHAQIDTDRKVIGLMIYKEIQSVPDLFSLQNLQKLYISDCDRPVTSGIGHLKQLISLSICNNKALRTLPKEMSQLSKLKTLTLDGCCFQEIPAVLATLLSLQNLCLDNNNISSISPSTFFENLQNLKELSFIHNNFTKLPCEALMYCKSLHTLHMIHNKLNDLSGIELWSPNLYWMLRDEDLTLYL
ncbi:unnamed protein product [Didymodactylos carnosus]|uniref:NAD(P)(+)--arginine ADP-ribosyltransferase n=1 Tax=Didymodactylos carnosus TaxID=1234261 RepID=A0A815BY16_9BILA|nr:unnamed protein product [Didymodactylos carnosus]CAF1276432.1 unnamed protein product [Didymodactylos carnosus]CAF3856859.1 unnamed protein product [Didymodactylos carnosus]CAF4068391.1 unnamed protein product [Didymodactylos carnosus]